MVTEWVSEWVTDWVSDWLTDTMGSWDAYTYKQIDNNSMGVARL